MSVRATCPGCYGAITIGYDPAEPMVRYYPDGSGYPGAPASAWIEDRDPDCDCEIDEERLCEIAEGHREAEAEARAEAAWDARRDEEGW
jgi:hypothetical protein